MRSSHLNRTQRSKTLISENVENLLFENFNKSFKKKLRMDITEVYRNQGRNGGKHN